VRSAWKQLARWADSRWFPTRVRAAQEPGLGLWPPWCLLTDAVTLDEFPVAAVTNDHKLSGFKWHEFTLRSLSSISLG
jgi:hypothetical protein